MFGRFLKAKSYQSYHTKVDGGRINRADTKGSGKQMKSVERADGDGLMVAASTANLRQIAHWKVGGIHIQEMCFSV
jgi:hypothetical protein